MVSSEVSAFFAAVASGAHVAAVKTGDSRDVLRSIPSNSVASVITSPPYWGVRDYEHNRQIGLETTLEEYLLGIEVIFSEVYRILKPTATMWINIGDVYTSGNRKYRDADRRCRNRGMETRPRTPAGLKPKDLVGVPWRVASRLQALGYYVRQEVIWHKTNALPDSARDRPGRSHEYLFLLSKSLQYAFYRDKLAASCPSAHRSVWSVQTRRSRIAGSCAVFPEALVLACLAASTQEHDVVLDPFSGSATVGRVCIAAERNFLGVELNRQFAKQSRGLLQKAFRERLC